MFNSKEYINIHSKCIHPVATVVWLFGCNSLMYFTFALMVGTPVWISEILTEKHQNTCDLKHWSDFSKPLFLHGGMLVVYIVSSNPYLGIIKPSEGCLIFSTSTYKVNGCSGLWEKYIWTWKCKAYMELKKEWRSGEKKEKQMFEETTSGWCGTSNCIFV